MLLAAGACARANAQVVTANVSAGPTPYALAVNPKTNQIFAINNAPDGRLTVIDGATYASKSVAVGSNPSALAVDTAADRIYITSLSMGTVTAVDGGSLATSTIALGAPGNAGLTLVAIAANPSSGRVYVADLNDGSGFEGSVTVIDGVTDTTTTTASGINPGASGNRQDIIAVNPVTNMIYVDNAVGGSVTEISGYDNGTFDVAVGTNPSSLAVDTATNTIYAASGTSNTVTIIDGVTNTTTPVTVGTIPSALAVNPVTNKVYVLNRPASGTVTVIDGATHATTTVAVGANPGAITVDPAVNRIFVLNETSPGAVTVIDGATNATTEVAVGNYPFAMALNTATDQLYVLQNPPNGSMAVLGAANAVPPSIMAGPRSQTVNAGDPVALSVVAAGAPSPTFQWTLDGAPLTDGSGISGSSTAVLCIAGGATAASAGAYACTVTNSAGSVKSADAALEVVSSATPGRLVNVSSRAGVGVGGNILLAGFVVRGAGSKTMILRGVGPALAGFGVPGTLAAPVLSLFDSANPPNLITEDSGWQLAPAVASGAWSGVALPADATMSDFSQVGAFSLPTGSTDSAIRITLPAGSYTSEVAGRGGGTGVALAEIYDADAGYPGTQLVNLSTRALVGIGGSILISGFTISGSTSRTVLIRASGPALGAFGVTGALRDPQLLLVDASQALVASNSGWGGNSQIASAAAAVGAFAWNDPSSNDSAILITLAPGSYTAQTSGSSGDTGVALLEVYAMP